MTKNYKAEARIQIYELENVPKEVIERKFIIDFFKSLPIEELKRLINYKEYDYRNKELWLQAGENYHYLSQLQDERVIKIEANIWLDNGIDDFYQVK